MSRYRSLAALLCVALLASCEKNAVGDITGPLPASRIKFFNFGVGAPGVNFYANDTKMTAIQSTTGSESATGTVYGGVGAGGLYSGIEAGQYTVTGRIAATVDKDVAISTVPVTIEDGKYYSFYQSGIYNATTKTVDGFIVEDAFPLELDYTIAHVRFVNAISNSVPMTLFAKDTASVLEVAIGGPVAYRSGGVFTPVPTGVYTLNTRAAGSATNIISRTGVSFVAGRVYTIGARGDITSTVTATRPFLDNTLNR